MNACAVLTTSVSEKLWLLFNSFVCTIVRQPLLAVYAPNAPRMRSVNNDISPDVMSEDYVLSQSFWKFYQDKHNTTFRRIYDVVNVCEGAGNLHIS